MAPSRLTSKSTPCTSTAITRLGSCWIASYGRFTTRSGLKSALAVATEPELAKVDETPLPAGATAPESAFAFTPAAIITDAHARRFADELVGQHPLPLRN